MKRHKKSFIILIFLFIIIIGRLYLNKSSLNYEERLEDIQYLIKFIDENYPNTEEKQILIENRQKIINKVSNSKNDRQFYINISETLRLLQNGHTKIADTSNIENYFLYVDAINTSYKSIYSDNIKEEAKTKSNYWDGIFIDTLYFPDIECKYIEGKYIVTNSSNEDINIGDEVIQIYNEDIESYLKNNTNLYKLSYDYARNKYFADKLFTINSEKKLKYIPVTVNDNKTDSKKYVI